MGLLGALIGVIVMFFDLRTGFIILVLAFAMACMVSGC